MYIDVDNYVLRYLYMYKDDQSLFKYMINGIKNLVSEFDPTAVLCCYDSGKSEYRLGLYPEYKANRIKSNMTEEDKDFLNRKKSVKDEFLQVMAYMGCHVLGSRGLEADDIISICVRKIFKNYKAVIVTSDKDYYQLVNTKVSVYSPIKKTLYDLEETKKVFNLTAATYLKTYSVMTKVLVGDPSDNVMGIKGIGDKKSLQLIERVLNQTMNEKDHKLLTENKDLINLNKKLIDLTQLPPDFDVKVKEAVVRSFKVQEDLSSKEYFSDIETKYSVKNLYTWFEVIKNNCLFIEPDFERLFNGNTGS